MTNSGDKWADTDEFTRGCLIACANLINGWDQTTLAEYLIGEVGIETLEDARRLDLTDYDLDALAKVLPSGEQP